MVRYFACTALAMLTFLSPLRDALGQGEKPATDEQSQDRTAEDKAAESGQNNKNGESAPDAEKSVTPKDDPEKQTPEPTPNANGEEEEEKSDPLPPEGTPPSPKRVIGATTKVLEKSSGFLFPCRVDTGAKSCSLHVEKLVIDGEDKENMANNYGKAINFLVKNSKGDEHWITSKITSHVLVKNASGGERRYKVPLVLRWKDCQKTVLVTLNDRSEMEFPMLLGRNFLAGDFVVDVDIDSNDDAPKPAAPAPVPAAATAATAVADP